jgi:hypothetical protein
MAVSIVVLTIKNIDKIAKIAYKGAKYSSMTTPIIKGCRRFYNEVVKKRNLSKEYDDSLLRGGYSRSQINSMRKTDKYKKDKDDWVYDILEKEDLKDSANGIVIDSLVYAFTLSEVIDKLNGDEKAEREILISDYIDVSFKSSMKEFADSNNLLLSTPNLIKSSSQKEEEQKRIKELENFRKKYSKKIDEKLMKDTTLSIIEDITIPEDSKNYLYDDSPLPKNFSFDGFAFDRAKYSPSWTYNSGNIYPNSSMTSHFNDIEQSFSSIKIGSGFSSSIQKHLDNTSVYGDISNAFRNYFSSSSSSKKFPRNNSRSNSRFEGYAPGRRDTIMIKKIKKTLSYSEEYREFITNCCLTALCNPRYEYNPAEFDYFTRQQSSSSGWRFSFP